MIRCLVIDDSEIIRRITRLILNDYGVEVMEAENGREGLEQCSMIMPDVILLDWQMPVMGPYGFLSALDKHAPLRRPTVIYSTTEVDVLDMARAKAAGADDVIVKPYDRQILIGKLEGVLRGRTTSSRRTAPARPPVAGQAIA